MIPYKFLLLCGILTLTSCSYESTLDLIDVPFVETVTYTNDVKPIIDGSCVGCHGNPLINGAPMSLTTYENVKQFVQNEKIINRISRDINDPQLMPVSGPKLPQPVIDLVIKWKDQGCLE
jgi:hypothetical protein